MAEEKRKIAATLGGLSAIGSVMYGTGAFSSAEAERGVTVAVAGDGDAFLALEPTDEGYASYEDGQLRIEMSDALEDVRGEGVNANARTYFADVFQIRNQGTQEVGVWIEHGSEHVTFETDSTAIDHAENATELDVGEAIPVDIVVDIRDEPVSVEDTLLEEMTIHANAAVEETVSNPGDSDGTFGTTRSIMETDLSPGEETTVEITLEDFGGGTVLVFERFDPTLGSASFVGASDGSGSIAPDFVDLAVGGGIAVFETVAASKFTVEYTLSVATDAPARDYQLRPNLLAVDGQAHDLTGPAQITVNN